MIRLNDLLKYSCLFFLFTKQNRLVRGCFNLRKTKNENGHPNYYGYNNIIDFTSAIAYCIYYLST